MGLADDVANVLHNQLKCQVAWLPISNTFALGDYGIISQGVFNKLGNVKEYSASMQLAEGPPVKLDFVSDETTVTSFAGNVQVDALPSDPAIDASIKIAFSRQGSFLIKARTVRVSAVENINQVMTFLHDRPGWRDSFKVVTRMWTAENAALLSTIADDTKVVLGAKAPALKKFQLGEVDIGINLSKSRELGLELLGVSGVIGLGLTHRTFFGGLESAANDSDEDVTPGPEQEAPSAIETMPTGVRLTDDV
jgi:hypothetical protein